MTLFRLLCQRILLRSSGAFKRRACLAPQRIDFRSSGGRTWCNGGVVLYGGLLSYLKSALNIEDISSPEDKLVETIKLGILNIQREEYGKAELILHAALRMALELNHSDGVLYVHDLLADLAFQKGEYTKAERLFTDVLGRLLGPPKNTPLSNNAVVEVSLKLAQIFVASGGEKDGKAEEGFKFCLRTMDKKMSGKSMEEDPDEDTRALWGMVHDKYGEYLLSRGKAISALPHFRTALQTATDLLGEDHPQTLVILNSLGTCQSLQGNYAEASESFGRAVELAKKEDSDSLQTYLVNLGMSFLHRDLLSDAKRACSSGLEISRKRKDTLTEAEAHECLKLVVQKL